MFQENLASVSPGLEPQFPWGGKMSWLVSTEAHSDLPLPSKTGRKPPFLGKKPPPIAHKS